MVATTQRPPASRSADAVEILATHTPPFSSTAVSTPTTLTKSCGCAIATSTSAGRLH